MSNEKIIFLLNLIDSNYDRLSTSGQSLVDKMFDDLDKGMSMRKFKKNIMDLCWDWDRMSNSLQQELKVAGEELGFEL
jgi:hypothetical protein